MTTQGQDMLTDLIDSYGILDVIDTLSGICGRKSEIKGNPSEAWETCEAIMDKAASALMDVDFWVANK